MILEYTVASAKYSIRHSCVWWRCSNSQLPVGAAPIFTAQIGALEEHAADVIVSVLLDCARSI